jgi:hypothetical protein
MELTLSLEDFRHLGIEFVAFCGIQVLSNYLTGWPEEHREISLEELQSPVFEPLDHTF